MTVYVDPLRTYPIVAIQPAARRYGRTWCHLWTDGDVEELHAFAARIGMRRAWFQPGPPLDHYDLVPWRRARALKAGAVEGSLAEHLRRKPDPDPDDTYLLE